MTVHKYLFVLVTLLLVGALIGACAPAPFPETAPAPTPSPTPSPAPEPTPEPHTTPTPTPSPSPTPTPTPSGKVIRLYYYGPSALGTDPAALPGTHRIYSATSSDGVNFMEDPGVRFSYDTKNKFGITDSDVVQLNDESWLMFVSLGTHLMKATAPTSLETFILDESFSWNRGGVPGSYNFDGTVRTFVCFQGGIHAATYDQDSSTLDYADVALNPPTSGFICDPSIIRVGDQYLMFYKYAVSHSSPPTEHEIYLATSTDGITWSQHAQNTFICQGSVPGAVYYNDIIYVYYCGLRHKPGAPHADLGVAISRDNGATFTLSTINIREKTAPGVVDPAAVVVSP